MKIQDGCEQFCSYCVIPYARGKLKSRRKNEVLKEVKQAVELNYNEIVLCGIHLGLYGKDIKNSKINLFLLLKDIIKIKNLGRIRLSSIEMNEVTDDLIDLITNSKKICKHLHIPLQSGNNKILKLMNRPYTTGTFEKKINKIRKTIPNIAITTDVITGFPNETKKDFIKIYDFIKKNQFSKLHIFPFSAHEKTPAFNFSNQVNEKEIKSRAKLLRILNKKLEDNYKKKFINKKLDVIVEKINKKVITGKTEFYFDIKFNKFKTKYNNKDLIGKIIKTK